MSLPSGTKALRIAVSDLNGQARGKRTPVAFAEKLMAEGARMPLSVLNVDIWGDDIENSPLVFQSGDRDGVLRPDRGATLSCRCPGLTPPTALLRCGCSPR